MPRSSRAVAAASVETGAPVMVHTNAAAQTGLLALEALTEAGVDPTRIVIAHAGDSNDLGYLRAIADTGASLGCDRFSIAHFNPDANRIETLAALVARATPTRSTSAHDARLLLRLHVRQPVLRRREARLPAHLDEDRPGAAGRRA